MKADDKHIEDFVSKVMRDTKKEKPSLGFTNFVMSQIEANHSTEITTYKPLISKNIWILIGFAILSTCLYLFMNTPSNETSWVSQLNFSALTNNNFTQLLSGLTISKTVVYTIVGFSLMICVQVPFLKHYFDKRLSL